MSFKKLLIKWFNITYRDIEIPHNLTTVKLVETRHDIVEVNSNYQIDLRSFEKIDKGEDWKFIQRELALGIGLELMKNKLVENTEVETVGKDLFPVKKYRISARVIKPIKR